VRAEVLPAAGSGLRTWMWDGLDQSGRRAAPGNYRVRVTSDDGGTSQPLVRVE
jgi:flagellar hook assembly protein FlgD